MGQASWSKPTRGGGARGPGPCTPERYLEVTNTYMVQVEKMASPKLNVEQCRYLAAELELAVGSANSFLELLNKGHFTPSAEEGTEICVGTNFRLLLALAMKVENFMKSCCTARRIQSAFTLTTVAEHVLSLSFDLKLLTLLFSDIKQSGACRSRRWTEEEVNGVFKAEAETVEKRASVDRGILLRGLDSVLRREDPITTDYQLAAYMEDLLERSEKPRPVAASAPLVLPDSKLFETVTRMKQIGKGASATVFKAKWLGSEVAVKTFCGPGNPDFEKEVSALIGLSHPNIVSLMGYKADERNCSTFMELLDKSLRTLMDERLEDGSLNRCTPFDILEAVDIMLQIGEGMRYVHGMRIVHGDLKSDNILVRCLRKPELHIELVAAAKVSDFGMTITKERSITYSDQMPNVGTTRWMAPEMMKSSIAESDKEEAEGESVALKYPFKSDVYSFALVCYEILSGNQPFPSIHEPKVVRSMVLNGLRPELPEACPSLLKKLIERCWSQDAIKRPSFRRVCVELRHLKCSLIMPSILEKVSPGLCLETSVSGEEVNVGAMEELDSYLELTKRCLQAVQKMSSPKFNNEQCRYLADKLTVVVRDASSFLEASRSSHHGPLLSGDVANWVEIFKLLLALAEQIEGFVEGCCRDAWVKAAMTLANVAEYLSSLGFNLELCRVVFSEGECAEVQSGLSLVDVDDINKAEAETVKQKASADMDSLVKKATLERHTSELARYLHQRLVRVPPNRPSDEGDFLGRVSDWVIPAWEPQLGRGATATVYKVMWLGTPVAKKTFFGPENPYFVKEVEILSQLCHPNITSMFCCTMNKRECSIIMELMDGDLFTLIQRRCWENSGFPPFSISEAVDLMLQVGEGVNYLHMKRIVHRDLKSMKILVKSVKASELDGGYVQAKVTDFGLSKTKERTSAYSSMSYNEGTFRWMAPELIEPTMDSRKDLERREGLLKYKFKCDIYSFAMVCYEILTGDLPFKEEWMPSKVKEKVLKGERPELADGCPTLLKALIEKCWNEKAEERPSFAVICSALRYLKYLSMRGKLTKDGAEPRLGQIQLLESEFLAEMDNMMALTLEVGGCSGSEHLKEPDFDVPEFDPDTNTRGKTVDDVDDFDDGLIDSDTDTETVVDGVFKEDTAGPSSGTAPLSLFPVRAPANGGTGCVSFFTEVVLKGWFRNRRHDF